MGYTRWSDDDWTDYSSTTKTKTADKIFTSTATVNQLDPKGVLLRESRDSDLNPESTAIIIGVDVTGSMGMIADYFVKEGLGVLFTHILDRKPVTDPHLMVMAIGDAAAGDRSPLQVSQFEADLKIAEQLEKIHVEHGGGGNSYESYELPWFFAANHISMDCLEKRGKKGYLFTIGDEPPSKGVIASQVAKVIGDELPGNISLIDMYTQVSKSFHTFHIIVKEGNHCRYHFDEVKTQWEEIMGQHAIVLTDYTKLSEVIESIIQVIEGDNIAAVTTSWSGDTSLVVASAIDGLGKTVATTTSAKGVVRF
jgi:hypothetical protein